MDLNLKGKNALVCGSTQGIGKAAAIELSLLGANVTLVARNEEKLKAAIKDLHAGDHHYLVADFSNPQDLEIKINALASEKTFHILINKINIIKNRVLFICSQDRYFANTFPNLRKV
jgi:3-oxoacyl-[acyl-carrier protein] reductase